MNIIDFINLAVYRRSELNQALLPNALKSYYSWGTHETSRLTAQELEAISQIPPELLDEPLRKRVLFIRCRSEVFIAEAAKQYEVNRMDGGEIRPAEKRTVAWHLPVIGWLAKLHEMVIGAEQRKYAPGQVLLNDAISFLEKLNLSALVINLDGHQLERTFAVAAKFLGIPVLNIQHGLFPESFPPYSREGDCCDAMVVWGKHFKDYHLKSGYLDESNIHVVGYPYSLLTKIPGDYSKLKETGLLFLGQPFEEYGVEMARRKQEIVEKVREACRLQGIAFWYRKHPGESLNSLAGYVSGAELRPESETLSEAFSRFGVTMSISSTALIEATMCGLVAIQVFEEAISLERFEPYGGSHLCEPSLESVSETLLKVFAGELGPSILDSNYVQVLGNPGVEFLQCLNKLCDDSYQSGTNKAFENFSRSVVGDCLAVHFDAQIANYDQAQVLGQLVFPCGKLEGRTLHLSDPRTLFSAGYPLQGAIDWLGAATIATKNSNSMTLKPEKRTDCNVELPPVWQIAAETFDALASAREVDVTERWDQALHIVADVVHHSAAEVAERDYLLVHERNIALAQRDTSNLRLEQSDAELWSLREELAGQTEEIRELNSENIKLGVAYSEALAELEKIRATKLFKMREGIVNLVKRN